MLEIAFSVEGSACRSRELSHSHAKHYAGILHSPLKWSLPPAFLSPSMKRCSKKVNLQIWLFAVNAHKQEHTDEQMLRQEQHKLWPSPGKPAAKRIFYIKGLLSRKHIMNLEGCFSIATRENLEGRDSDKARSSSFHPAEKPQLLLAYSLKSLPGSLPTIRFTSTFPAPSENAALKYEDEGRWKYYEAFSSPLRSLLAQENPAGIF